MHVFVVLDRCVNYAAAFTFQLWHLAATAPFPEV